MMTRRLWRAVRASALAVGLTATLSVFVLSATALGANGDRLLLGLKNVATAVTRLAGGAGVDGPMLRIVNNNAGTDDTALDLRVQDGEPPLTVNSDALVSRLNADQVDGFHVGCAVGRRLIAGYCWDEAARAATFHNSAANACHGAGGALPGAMHLRAIRSEPGIDLGSFATQTEHWTGDVQFAGTASPPNSLYVINIADSGGMALVDYQESRPYRCYYLPLVQD